MAGFLFRLETADGAPVEPSTLSATVPSRLAEPQASTLQAAHWQVAPGCA